MSSNPTSPNGVKTFLFTIGEINDSRFIKATLKNSAASRGKLLKWSDVPNEVKTAIQQVIK